MVCLLAASWVQLSVSAGNGWPHNALRHHWLVRISCYLRDCRALLVTSLTDVSGAITSVLTFTFTFVCHHANFHANKLLWRSIKEFGLGEMSNFRLMMIVTTTTTSAEVSHIRHRSVVVNETNERFPQQSVHVTLPSTSSRQTTFIVVFITVSCLRIWLGTEVPGRRHTGDARILLVHSWASNTGLQWRQTFTSGYCYYHFLTEC